MKLKTFVILITLTFFSFNLYSQISKDSIRYCLSEFNISLQNKDIARIEQTFSRNFSLATESRPVTHYYLEKIFEFQDFKSVELIENSIRNQNNKTLVDVIFHLKDNKTENSIIALDSTNKILFVDYFDRFFGYNRYKESLLIGILPFEQKDESIILKIRLNDNSKALSFLLDTGADGMAIRKTLADSLSLNIGHTQNTNVVGAQMQVNISQDNTVHLSDSLSLKNQNIAVFESIEGMDGIIGLNFIRRYITSINFDEKRIYLYTFGNHQYKDEGISLPISKPSLILVPSSLDLVGKKSVSGNFIMDTGANYHLILFSKFVRKNRLLLSGFKPEGQATTVSMGQSTPVFFGKAFEFKLGEEISQKDMPITLQASSGKDQAREDMPDGSIGIQFFNKYNFTIDLLRKELHLVPRK